ncbi:hypothetical protein F5883DRAFT_634056 [Diaporthe sp. PMI_573]|nr:hypothetical protein F5883DRAFT_634056 [Diaporthaceae sp. PMI_573]
MELSKEEEARRATLNADDGDGDGDALPAYSDEPSQGPTAESPFNFPSDVPAAPAPTYLTASPLTTSAGLQRPIAIPQITLDKTAPFLDAYVPPLLQYGITPLSWRSFLSTMSAFLAAKVSEKALSHAVDMGRYVVYNGNFVGAAFGVVGGAISLPIVTAACAVGAVASLPGVAIGAVTQKPQTPRERAAAYVAAATRRWLEARGLLLDIAHVSADQSAAGQIGALRAWIGELRIFTGSTLNLGADTLWLVI